MDTKVLTDGELMGRLLGEIGALAGVGAEALLASARGGMKVHNEGIIVWLAESAARYTLASGSEAVLETFVLTEEWREGILRVLEGGRDGVSVDVDLAGG